MLQLIRRLSISIAARIADQIKIQSYKFPVQVGAISDLVEAVIDRLYGLERERVHRLNPYTSSIQPVLSIAYISPISDPDRSNAMYWTLLKSNGIESETFRILTYLKTDLMTRSRPVCRTAAIRESRNVKRGAALFTIRTRTTAGINHYDVLLEYRYSGRYRVGVTRSWDAAKSVISPAIDGTLGPQNPLVPVRH